MSSPEYRSGSRRSRSKSRSRTPARRRYSRSRSQSGSEEESYGGSGQDNYFPPPGDVLYGYATAEMPRTSHIWVMGLLLRLQRRLTSEDRAKKRPPEFQCASPSDTTRHAADESSDTSEDNDDSYENFNDALLSLKVRFKEPLQC